MLQQAIVEHGQRFAGSAPIAFVMSPGACRGLVEEMLRDPLARPEIGELLLSILDGAPRFNGVLLLLHPGVEGVALVEIDGAIREV